MGSNSDWRGTRVWKTLWRFAAIYLGIGLVLAMWSVVKHSGDVPLLSFVGLLVLWPVFKLMDLLYWLSNL